MMASKFKTTFDRAFQNIHRLLTSPHEDESFLDVGIITWLEKILNTKSKSSTETKAEKKSELSSPIHPGRLGMT